MENKIVSFAAKVGKPEKFNSQFHMVKVYIAYAGKNRNYTYISKETFEKMIPSLYGVPVVGEWKEDNDDFGSHGGKIQISEDGIEFIDTTKPYGFIDSSATVQWEDVTEEDGTINSYLTVSAFLWSGRYPEVLKVLENKNGQSMELCVFDGQPYEDDEQYFEILDGEFSAICILGEEIEPCFESAKISQFNLDKEAFKAEFELMVKELKQSLFEGGESVGNEKLKDGVAESTEEIEETFKDETENEVGDNADEAEEFNNETTDDNQKEDKFSKTFELSHDDIRSKLYSLLSEIEEEDDEWYYINEVFDEYFIYSGFKKTYKQNYIKTDVDVAFEGERVEMFVEYLTAEELEELNNMRSNYSLILKENEELKAFKSDILEQQKANEIEEVFNKYSTLLDVSDYEDLKENAINMEIEELEKELSFRLVQKKFDFSKITKKDSTKITIKEDKNDNDPYGSASVYFSNK